jgi:hypothetical protein
MRFSLGQLEHSLIAGGGGPIYPWSVSPDALEGVLHELREFGVMQTDGEVWWMEKGAAEGGGTGDGGRVPPGNRGGDDGHDDDGRGGGLAEVLAHPLLFSSEDAEFERALRSALSL